MTIGARRSSHVAPSGFFDHWAVFDNSDLFANTDIYHWWADAGIQLNVQSSQLTGHILRCLRLLIRDVRRERLVTHRRRK